jgi:hypothetical protein
MLLRRDLSLRTDMTSDPRGVRRMAMIFLGVKRKKPPGQVERTTRLMQATSWQENVGERRERN